MEKDEVVELLKGFGGKYLNYENIRKESDESARKANLLQLCRGEVDRVDAIRDLLKSLSEDERGQVVNAKDEVSLITSSS